VRAGQEVRMVDMQADAGAGYGAFERLHEADSPAAFSEGIVKACSRVHGTAAPAFIEWLIAHQEGLPAKLRSMVDGIACQMIPESAAGQVHRVGGRFALVAAAGELATQAGITGWPEGEATRAARQCFEAWMKQRGGLGNAEQYQMLAQVRNFLQLHGAGRFTSWDRAEDHHAPDKSYRAGYRRSVGSDADLEGKVTVYYIFIDVFDKEVCQGFDPTAVKRLLLGAEHLEPTTDKAGNFERYARRERLPYMGITSVIKIKPSIFDGSE
jgi:putative DNA primase/helicase